MSTVPERGNLTDALVYSYLKKRGFTDSAFAAAAAALPLQARTLAESTLQRSFPDMEQTVHNRITLFQGGCNHAASYTRLRDWVHGSLDLYKPELLRVLYPVLVHCYLQLVLGGHGEAARALLSAQRGEHAPQEHELSQLALLTEPGHVHASPLAQNFLLARYGVQLSRYSFTLLLSFLQQESSHSPLTLALVNEHLQLTQLPGEPCTHQEVPVAPRTGLAPQTLDSVNLRRVQFGLLESSPLVRASRVERKEGDAPDAGLPSGYLLTPSRLPEGALPTLNPQTDLTLLRDLRSRVRLGGASLPSCVMYTLSHAEQRVCCATINASGSRLACGFADSQVRVWDLDRASRERAEGGNPAATAPFTLTGHAGPVYGVEFTPSEEYLLSCGGDHSVRLWSTELCAQLMAYAGHSHPVWTVSSCPRGHYFASGGYDRTARVWALDSAHARRVFVGHASDVECVAWHPSCNYVGTGSSDRSCRLWDVASGECVRVLAGHAAPPRALSFSPDGRTLATASDDGAVAVWDLGTAKRLACVPPGAHGGSGGAGGGVTALAWSAEGALLASGGQDGALRLWDAQASLAAAAAAGPAAAGAVPLQLAKTLRTRAAQLQTMRFSNKNMLYVTGSR